MPLTIVTVLMPFYKSADTLSRFRGHPLTIPRTHFDDSVDVLGDAAEKLWISDADNLRISLKFLVTSTVDSNVLVLSGTREAGCFREVAALHIDHLRQVPLYSFVHLVTTVICYSSVTIPLTISAFYHPSASTDYHKLSRRSVHFRAGVNEVSFTVTIRDVGLVEIDEEFYIELEIPPTAAASCSVVKGSPDNATVIIRDDDGECCLKCCKAEHNENILTAINVRLNSTAL